MGDIGGQVSVQGTCSRATLDTQTLTKRDHGTITAESLSLS